MTNRPAHARTAGFTATEAVVVVMSLGLLVAAGSVVVRVQLQDRDFARFDATAHRFAQLTEANKHRFDAAMADPRLRRLRGRDDETYLHAAGRYADVRLAAWLLEEGFAIDARDGDGQTPLAYAIRNVRHEIAHDDLVRYVTFLLDHGADPNAADDGGRTPLHAAADKPEPSFAMLLLRAGANPDACGNAEPRTPLAVAASLCHYSVVKVLLDHGADPEKGDPLRHAASAGHHAVVLTLLEAGGDPTESAIAAARGADHTAIAKLLERGRTADLSAAPVQP